MSDISTRIISLDQFGKHQVHNSGELADTVGVETELLGTTVGGRVTGGLPALAVLF